MLQTPLDIGIRFIETLWFSFASRIVEKAIEVYKVDPERAELLKQKFLKRGEFQVIVQASEWYSLNDLEAWLGTIPLGDGGTFSLELERDLGRVMLRGETVGRTSSW